MESGSSHARGRPVSGAPEPASSRRRRAGLGQSTRWLSTQRRSPSRRIIQRMAVDGKTVVIADLSAASADDYLTKWASRKEAEAKISIETDDVMPLIERALSLGAEAKAHADADALFQNAPTTIDTLKKAIGGDALAATAQKIVDAAKEKLKTAPAVKGLGFTIASRGRKDLEKVYKDQLKFKTDTLSNANKENRGPRREDRDAGDRRGDGH